MVRRILFLASNPTDTGRLRLDKEFREIGEGLRRSNQRDQFDLVPAFAVKTGDLRRALLDHAPRIVHFAGHDGAGGIVVEGDDGKACQIPNGALTTLFELCAQQIECVVLNACHSQIQAEAIAQHIPYVIGMSTSISDSAAIEFAVGFYDALGAGKSIEDAYRFGCNAIALSGIPENLTPILRKHKTTEAEARQLESAYSPSQNIYMDVSVLNTDTSSWNRGANMVLGYSLGRTADSISIASQLGYIEQFDSGEPIAPLNYISGCPFKWDFPILDFKILNKLSEPLFLTELILDVSESRPECRPLLAIKQDSQQRFAGSLLLVNEGCDLFNVTIAFHLSPGQLALPSFEPPFRHSVDLAELRDYAEVDVTDAFSNEGVDINGLTRLYDGEWGDEKYIVTLEDGSKKLLSKTEVDEQYKTCLGPFQDAIGTLSGEITYATTHGGTPKRPARFLAYVYLANKNRLGLPRPPTYAYDTSFETEAANYQKRVQISHTLQPNEADRFTIRVAVMEPSLHRFRATLRDVTGITITSLPVEMKCFVPRSQRHRLPQINTDKQ